MLTLVIKSQLSYIVLRWSSLLFPFLHSQSLIFLLTANPPKHWLSGFPLPPANPSPPTPHQPTGWLGLPSHQQRQPPDSVPTTSASPESVSLVSHCSHLDTTLVSTSGLPETSSARLSHAAIYPSSSLVSIYCPSLKCHTNLLIFLDLLLFCDNLFCFHLSSLCPASTWS